MPDQMRPMLYRLYQRSILKRGIKIIIAQYKTVKHLLHPLMIIDSHVHMGWFSDGYHSPQKVWKEIEEAGIDKIAVSSTSSCADLYSLVLREMRTIIRIAPDKVAPILWLTTHLLQFPRQLSRMINVRGIEWAGVKIHLLSHPQIFTNRNLLNRAIQVARSLELPVLIHTGEFPNCHAGAFASLCKENTDIKFILAHGRPIKETIEVMKSCSNVYTDTAFMQFDHIQELVDCGLSKKVLFGSDAPINMIYYPQYSTREYLEYRISHIREIAQCVLSNNIYFK